MTTLNNQDLEISNTTKEKGFWSSLFGDSSSSDNIEDDKLSEENELKLLKFEMSTEKGLESSQFGDSSSNNEEDDKKEVLTIKKEVNLEPLKSKTIDNTIPIINTTNNELNNFINTFCKSIYTMDIIKNIFDEIFINQELYESEPFRISNLKYRLCNSLSNHEKIYDNFFDIGPSSLSYSTNLNDFKLNTLIINDNQLREIIIFDPTKDDKLNLINSQIKNIPKDDNIYKSLIELIINNLGNETEDYKFNKFITTFSNKNKTNILYIGDLNSGIDRHKSLLFKYLCDQLNLECCIFRYVNISDNKIYDKHVWNLIKINGCIYVVDFTLFPNRIVKPTDKNTKNYYKINEFIL